MVNERFWEDGKPHSLLGFGIMRLPTLPDGSIDIPLADEMFKMAWDGGVTYFDTGYGYHDGQSEQYLRHALEGIPRAQYLLADKLPLWALEKPEDAERIFNEQLERCGVTYFDYYLAHAISKGRLQNMRKLGAIDFLRRMKAEGKVRHLGFSFHDDLDGFRDAMTEDCWEFCQLQLNYADWNRYDARSLHALALSYRLPIIVMEPVRGGFLATPPQPAATLLQEAAPARTAASWALRFTASLPGVKLVLSGMSTPAQVADNLATFADHSVYLGEQEQQTICAATQLLDQIHSIPCTACRYCMPCPAGVDIPGCLRAYNNATFLGHGNGGYRELPEDTRANRCIACGACSPQCPQHIDIPERLAAVHQKLDAVVE